MKLIPLGELCEIVMGQAPPAEMCNKDGVGIAFVKAGEFTNRYPLIREWTTRPLRKATEGDVLVCVVGATAGKICLGVDSAIGRSVAAIRPDAERLTTLFLYYFLQTRTILLRGQSQGMAQEVITLEMLEGVLVPWVPLEEQRRIAAILDKADALLQKRRLALQKLDSLTQSIFLDTFGDPVANPKKIVKKSLKELIELKSGNFLPSTSMTEGPYPVYGGNGIAGYHDEFMFEDRQIVIGRVGVYCGVVHVSDKNAWVTDNALYVAWKSPELDSTYLATALSIANLNQYAGQAAQPLISGSRIYPVEILVPTKLEQAEFANMVAVKQALDSKFARSTKIAERLFSSLQQNAFDGGFECEAL